MTIHLPKVNGFGGGNGGGGGSSSFPIIVTDSGGSLPSASGYQLNDTFLNTIARKIYKANMEGYELNTNVTSTVDNVDLFTGVATGFGYNKDVIKTSSNFLWSGNTELRVHFKQTYMGNPRYIVFLSMTSNGTNGRYACVCIYRKKLYFSLLDYDGQQDITTPHTETEITTISTNTEYYLKVTKTGTSGRADLYVGGYDTTPIASVDFVTEDYIMSGATSSILQFGGNASSYFYQNDYLNAYLLDSTGDFLVPSTTLTWDSGTDLIDNTEYADRTNRILYLYLGSGTLLPIGGVPIPTTRSDETSTDMALKRNSIYKWTTALTSLSFASVEVSDLETVLYFTTGGTISFTDSSSLKWGGDGTAPSLEINTIYCISIRNGLAEIDTFGTTA